MRADRLGSRPRRVGLLLRVTLPAALAGEAAALLAPAASGVVSLEAPAGPRGEIRRRVEARLDPGAQGEALVAALAGRLAELERRHPGADFDVEQEEQLVEEDVGAAHRERFVPLLAAPGLVLAPPWHPHAGRGGERVLVVDPGSAFGSGFHASTRLALALLQECCATAPPERMLDVGTGTGVLAMAGALWGAGEVVAVDSDPAAVAAAAGNVARNGLSRRVRVAGCGLEGLRGPFGLVVANITVDVLAALACPVAALLAPGGRVVLSGLLAGEQEEEARTAYAASGLALRVRRAEGEWAALLLAPARGTEAD